MRVPLILCYPVISVPLVYTNALLPPCTCPGPSLCLPLRRPPPISTLYQLLNYVTFYRLLRPVSFLYRTVPDTVYLFLLLKSVWSYADRHYHCRRYQIHLYTFEPSTSCLCLLRSFLRRPTSSTTLAAPRPRLATWQSYDPELLLREAPVLRLAILVKLDYSVLIMEVARRPSLWRVEPRFDKKVKRGNGGGG